MTEEKGNRDGWAGAWIISGLGDETEIRACCFLDQARISLVIRKLKGSQYFYLMDEDH